MSRAKRSFEDRDGDIGFGPTDAPEPVVEQPKKKPASVGSEVVVINPPNIVVRQFTIQGNAPYVQCAFAMKARNQIRAKQEAGSQAKKGTAKAARDFDADYKGAMHVADGWHGIPANGIRQALVRACALVDYEMTLGKQCLFVEADGYETDGSPLVRITKGTPRPMENMGRTATGVPDIRIRPMWAPGWQAVVRIRFDADRFDSSSIANLLARAGLQVGIGEGRPFSKKSCGQGWGTFDVLSPDQE